MSQFQSGQQHLTGFPASGLMPIDNGGPQNTVLPQAAGSFTLNEATPVTVADSGVTAGSIIIFTLKTVGGTLVAGQGPNVMTITPGTGFTVAGAATDQSVYNWVRIG